MASAPSAPPGDHSSTFYPAPALAPPPPPPPPPPPAPHAGLDADNFRMQKLQALAAQYEIRADWVAKLRQLESFDIAVLCDDSGSMSTACAGGGAPANPYAPIPTRWDELRNTVSMVVQLASALGPRGVDVHFLNRPPLLGVTDAAQLAPAFAFPPRGFTPLARAFQGVLAARRAAGAERNLLLLIATDGQPTDDGGSVRIPEFLRVLAAKERNVFVQIMACTDDDEAIEWMNQADDQIPRVDVCDDFHSERREVLRAQGAGFHCASGARRGGRGGRARAPRLTPLFYLTAFPPALCSPRPQSRRGTML